MFRLTLRLATWGRYTLLVERRLKVSCILPPLEGREPAFARRAIYYFQRQTYDLKELVIVTESPEKFADLEDENIKVVKAFDSSDTGKVTQGIEEASGDVIFRWDDDDISFPNRVMESLAEFKTNAASVMGLTSAFFYDYENRSIHYCPLIRNDYFHPSGVMWRNAWEGRNGCQPRKFAPLQNITVMLIGAHPSNTVNKRGWMKHRTFFEVKEDGYTP